MIACSHLIRYFTSLASLLPCICLDQSMPMWSYGHVKIFQSSLYYLPFYIKNINIRNNRMITYHNRMIKYHTNTFPSTWAYNILTDDCSLLLAVYRPISNAWDKYMQRYEGPLYFMNIFVAILDFLVWIYQSFVSVSYLKSLTLKS